MTVAPVADPPSPKVHAVEYGAVPPVVVLVNVTSEFTAGLVGLDVKLVDNGGGGDTVTVLELVAVWDGEDESVAVSVTVNDWAVVNVWVTVGPVPIVPSPKFQVTV